MKNKDGFDVATRERLHDLLEPRLGERTDAAISTMQRQVFTWLAIPLPQPGLHGRKRDALVKARKALKDLTEALHSEDGEPWLEVLRGMAMSGAFGPIPTSEELAALALASDGLPPLMQGESIDDFARGLDANPTLRVSAFVHALTKNPWLPPLGTLKSLGLTLDDLIGVEVKGGRPTNIGDKAVTAAVSYTLECFGIEPTRGGEMSASVFYSVLKLVLIDLHDKVDGIAGPNAVDGLVRWAVEVRKAGQNPQ